VRVLRRKGISPVIAVLLLIVIAVAAAILTYVWLTGYMGTLQAQSGAQQVQEKLKIEGVKVETGDNTIKVVYVRNIGDVTITISAAYLMDSSGNVIAADTELEEELDPGESRGLEKLENIGKEPLTPGKTYIIKVVSEKGTEVTYQFTYRK